MFFEQSKEIKRCQKSKEIEIEKGVREGEKNVGLWTKTWGALKKKCWLSRLPQYMPK